MVIDAVSYNGEADLLEIRLNILNDYVDEFIIVEAPTTFSGKEKLLYFREQEERFKQWRDKIRYFVVDEDWTQEEIDLAQSSPNTAGAAHWVREFLQKESIKKALTHLKEDDIVFIGDCDEVWNPEAWNTKDQPEYTRAYKLRCQVYAYFLNNASSEEFYGPIVSDWRYLKNTCLNHLRSTDHVKVSKDAMPMAWHFTSMGGTESVKKKLTDSYTQESYATPSVLENLEYNMASNKDFLSRDFTYTLDESSWPGFLVETREKYIHLIK